MLGKVHHANIFLRQGDQTENILSFFEKELNFNTKKNPDFLFLENDSFGIEDARNFEKWSIGKPFGGEIKVALITAGSLTFEAQNALLKVFEEPTPGTYIFLSLENLGGVLPTLLSRVQVLDFSQRDTVVVKSNTKDPAQKFLQGDIKDRLALIRSLSKGDRKPEMKSLIQDLDRSITKDDFGYNAKKSILTAKIFASARGSSSKMLLEWLACVV